MTKTTSVPQEVLVAADGEKAYVSCDQSGKVAVINIADWKLEGSIDGGKGTDKLAWAAVKYLKWRRTTTESGKRPN